MHNDILLFSSFNTPVAQMERKSDMKESNYIGIQIGTKIKCGSFQI